MAPTAVIFDLDGTLVQTRIASWQVFREISERFGLGIEEPEQYFALFDGNLYASLDRLCRDEQHAAEVKQAFLELLGTDYRPWLVPGMADVVRRLAGSATLAVMSSNATGIIRRILTENDLALCFSHVFGGDVNESKERGIERFLADATFGPGRRCESSYDESATPQPHDPRRTVLVTDTIGDVREARAAGIRTVGVSWGMHSPDDLLGAGAEFVALWPQEILSHLLGDEASREPEGACAVGPTRTERPEADPPPGRAVAAPCRCGGNHWSTQRPVASPTPAAIRRARRTAQGRDASTPARSESQPKPGSCCGSCALSGGGCAPPLAPSRPRGSTTASRPLGRRTAADLRAAVAQIC